MNVFKIGALEGIMSEKLKPDNPSHRGFSNDLDNKYTGQDWYDKAARPIVHGVYHAVRAFPNEEEVARSNSYYEKAKVALSEGKVMETVVNLKLGNAHRSLARVTPNEAELARAKDQFGKIATGQQQSEYLEDYNANKEQQKRQ